jgi:MarR family transcriptional regulator, transcriptional regulator for hemolysin
MTSIDALRLGVTTTANQIGRYWRRLAHDVVAAHGISDACAFPLITIARMGDGIRQITLADAVGLEGPSLVRLLDQLCASGLVERREDSVDRRAKTLSLTPQGKQATETIERALVLLREQVLGGISQEDLEATLRVFRAIEDATRQTDRPPRDASAAA